MQLPLAPGSDTKLSALVCLRAGGSKPPLYCVHAQSGHLRLYDNLAARLPPDRPVYGLRAVPQQEDPQSTGPRLEDLARQYAHEIVAFQPEGPYVIVGECDGGELAFELARQLGATGREVSLLALIDSFGPGGPRVRPSVPHVAYRAADGLRMLSFHARTVARLPPVARLEYLRTRLIRATAKLATKLLGRHGPQSGEALRQQAYRQALDGYEALSYPGRVLLLRGARLPWGVEASLDLGWADVAPVLETDLLPAYFGTNMLEPHVAAVARRLDQAVDAATGTQEHASRGR
jgi:thioesterase domain-containing protein